MQASQRQISAPVMFSSFRRPWTSHRQPDMPISRRRSNAAGSSPRNLTRRSSGGYIYKKRKRKTIRQDTRLMACIHIKKTSLMTLGGDGIHSLYPHHTRRPQCMVAITQYVCGEHAMGAKGTKDLNECLPVPFYTL